MSDMDYLESIKLLPKPTSEQIARFKEHLLSVHSWYKHLPLLEGARFTVYLEPDLDREYPQMHPKLPFGNHQEGYEKAFGHLWYRYSTDGAWFEDYDTKIVDGKRVKQEMLAIPEELLKAWTFTLYPYCHLEFEQGVSLMEDDFESIQSGHPHPQAGLLKEWHRAFQAKENCWYEEMREDEKEVYFSVDDEELEAKALPLNVAKFIGLRKSLRELEARLRAGEMEKVEGVAVALISQL